MKRYSSVWVRETGKSMKVTIASASFPDIEQREITKWQRWLDLVASMANIPAALIMKLNEDTIEVFLKSNSTGNPFRNNEKTTLGNGLFCENVIGTQGKLLIPDATANPMWSFNNPDVDLNLISYLGYPLNWPDGEVFGTICILDNKENQFTKNIDEFLFNLKQNIESDLELLISKQLLTESEEKFRLLFDLMPQPTFIIDAEDITIEEINQKMKEITEFPKNNIIGTKTTEYFHVDEKIHKKIISELQNKGEIDGMKISFQGHDNEMNYYLLYSKMISIKNKFKSINLLVDIKKLKNAELEIKRLNTAIEKSASSFIITNSNAEIIYVNEYFTKLTGYSPDEVLGKKPKILKSGFHTETFYKELWDTINQGKIWTGEFYNKKKNGDLYWETATIAPIFDEGGDKIINFVSNKQDITKSKLQMAALRQSEQKLTEMNATKDKFFSIVGHDLMNPFNALLGFSNLLTEALKMKDMENALKYSVIIEQSSQIILNLLHDLLIWSKAQSGKIKYNPALIHISDLINVTLSLLMPGAQNKKITLQTDVEGNIKAFIDYNMISSVIRNLVDNALKFTNQGGNIKITAKINNGALCITVSDNGIGIDENQMSNLFQIDKSYTTKGTENETGSGLGLIISKEFIDIHKGKIWAESTPGKGSDFHFTVPTGSTV